MTAPNPALNTDAAHKSENARLQKLVAERDLESEVMKEIAANKMVSAQVRREQTHLAVERELSQR